jgi:AAA domain
MEAEFEPGSFAPELHEAAQGSASPRKWGRPTPPQVIAVTSGKGGVGKSNVVVNLGLAQRGLSVLLIDADLELGNLDILLGLTPRFSIQDALASRLKLADVIMDGPGGLKILPASSGIAELAFLDESQKLFLLSELDHYTEAVDVVLIDTGAGISPNVLFFNLGAQERILVVNNQPLAIADALPGDSVRRDPFQAAGERSGAPLGGGIGLSDPAHRGGPFSGPGGHLGLPRFCALRSRHAQSSDEAAAGPDPLPPVAGQPVFCHDRPNSVGDQAPAYP